MQKHERSCLAEVKRILEPKGFVVWVEHNKVKMEIWAQRGTWQRRHVVPSSPRCDNTNSYARQWAQRVLRDVSCTR